MDGTSGLNRLLTTASFAQSPQSTIAKPSAKAIRAMIERQGFRCGLTGRLLTPACAQMDHVVPLSRGGEHAIDNVEVLHEAINRAKGTMTRGEFIAMCREVIAHVDGVQ